MGEFIPSFRGVEFSFRLQPPRLIAEEIAAEEGQREAKPALTPDLFQFFDKYKLGRYPLTPRGTIVRKPQEETDIQFVSVFDVLNNFWDGETFLKEASAMPSSLAERWDADRRATYNCDYYRNCADTVPLAEIRFTPPW